MLHGNSVFFCIQTIRLSTETQTHEQAYTKMKFPLYQFRKEIQLVLTNDLDLIYEQHLDDLKAESKRKWRERYFIAKSYKSNTTFVCLNILFNLTLDLSEASNETFSFLWASFDFLSSFFKSITSDINFFIEITFIWH